VSAEIEVIVTTFLCVCLKQRWSMTMTQRFCFCRHRYGDGRDKWGFVTPDGCEKRHFLRHLYIKCIFLPRQARDKHRENSKKSGVLCRKLLGNAHRNLTGESPNYRKCATEPNRTKRSSRVRLHYGKPQAYGYCELHNNRSLSD
jgi:hypothetical protein